MCNTKFLSSSGAEGIEAQCTGSDLPLKVKGQGQIVSKVNFRPSRGKGSVVSEIPKHGGGLSLVNLD